MELNLDRFFPHPPPKVWQVLTQRVERWLPARGFSPVKGCVFFVDGPESPGYDGRAACTVLDVVAPRRLTFSWRGGPVDSLVTLELLAEHEGTRVRLRHTGLPGEKLSGTGLPLAWDGWFEAMRGPLGVPSAKGPNLVLLVAGLGTCVVGLLAVSAVAVVVAKPTAPAAIALPPAIPVPHVEPGPPPSRLDEPPPAGLLAEACGGFESSPILEDGCLTAELHCGETLTGSTRGGVNRFDTRFYEKFFCTPATTDHDGGDERVYRLKLPEDTRALVYLDTPCADLDLAAVKFDGERCPTNQSIVNQCEDNIKRGTERERVDLWNQGEATWYVIVEGKDEEEGRFALSVQCEHLEWRGRPGGVTAEPSGVAAPGGEGETVSGGSRFEGEGHAETPVFSADGKYLAFEVNAYGENNIALFYTQLAGTVARDSEEIRLAGSGVGKSLLVNATWHPSQPILLFEGSTGGDTRLYLTQPGGQAPSEFITRKQLPAKLSFPQFSPDGMLLAFVSSATGDGDIYVRDSANGEIRRVTTDPGSEAFPSFRKDGQRLAFTRKVGGTEDVIAVDVATGAEVVVAAGPGDQTRPVYAENGAVVYFTNEGGAANHWDLAVVDADGQRILAKHVRLPTRARPAITPNGAWVGWTSADPTGSSAVHLTRIDGSKTIDVPSAFAAPGDPAFGTQPGPDGTRLMLAYTYLPQPGADWRHLTVVDITDRIR